MKRDRVILMALPLFVATLLNFSFLDVASAQASKDRGVEDHVRERFQLDRVAQVPEVYAADDLKADGVRSFFYRGLDYHGTPTRVFAYYGVPASAASNPQQKFPAMVLIHGGGGTAFDRWVKVWNDRGYAAIAMDLCGCVPVGTYGKWQRHEQGGPPGWQASFEQLDDPIEDQWTFQAVNAVMLAHTLIRSYPEVDASRIGVTGISWGGYLTCITAGVDSRFRFAVPVYGCGFLGENSAWLPAFEKMGSEQSSRWLKMWDPSVYLPHVSMPMLWVNGTNDFAYPMDSWQKSYRLPKTKSELCLRIRMPHGHGPAGENPEEIRVFADSILKDGPLLPKLTQQVQEGTQLMVQFESPVPVTRAELTYTRDSGRWQDRMWNHVAANLDLQAKTATGEIPEGATAFYINLFDERDCVVSSEHLEAPATSQSK